MKKLFLIIIILLCAAFIYLRLQAGGNPSSHFNQTTRFALGKSAFWRTVLGLHNYGDARAAYLNSGSLLELDILEYPESTLNPEALNDFEHKLQAYTGRSVAPNVIYIDQSGTLTDTDLHGLLNRYVLSLGSGQTPLVVIYAQDYKRDDGELGKTLDEFGMILSDARLREVAGTYPDALIQYQESTLLHEFGHQIGLDHNDEDNCIMNAKVEKPDVTETFTRQYTPTDFCESEKLQINNIKATLK